MISRATACIPCCPTISPSRPARSWKPTSASPSSRAVSNRPRPSMRSPPFCSRTRGASKPSSSSTLWPSWSAPSWSGTCTGPCPGGDRRASLVSRRTQDPTTHGGTGATAVQPCPTPPPLQGRKGGGSLHPHPHGPPDPGPHPPRRPSVGVSLRITRPLIIHQKSDSRSAECGPRSQQPGESAHEKCGHSSRSHETSPDICSGRRVIAGLDRPASSISLGIIDSQWTAMM